MEPDRMHLHQKCRRGIEVIWVGRGRRHLSNPLATLFMLPIITVPVLTGVLVWDSPGLAWLLVVLYAAAFVVIHLAITVLAKRHRKISFEGAFPRYTSTGIFGRYFDDVAGEDMIVSPYSGIFVQGCSGVNVLIYKNAEMESWQLRTEADRVEDRVWNIQFETDSAAWAYFYEQADRFGMSAVMGPRKRGRKDDHLSHGLLEF